MWKWEERAGEITKIPYNPATGKKAKANDPSTWASFNRAVEVFQSTDAYDGIGFEFAGTPFCGIDFDHLIHDGIADPFVHEIIRLAGNPYCEISPSGNGLHAFVNCSTLPKGKRKFGTKDFAAEIYIGSEGGRYFTVTGKRFSGSGSNIPQIEDIGLIYILISQIADEKFKRLWMGDVSQHNDDDSLADFALLTMLARLTNCDARKMEMYFSQSWLAQRDKWRERDDYRERSINAAIEEVRKDKKIATDESVTELEFHLAAVITDQIDDYVVQPAPGQMDGWFPLDAPSLVGGASGSAKTTWMMQLLLAQFNRETVLGHATCGRPFLVLMADRGPASHKRTIRRLGMEKENIPIKFFVPEAGTAVLQEIINRIEETNPRPQIVFIEGCDMLVEDANKKHIVGPFMGALQRIATHYHIAIIGSVGAPKTKAGEGYIAKRDNISGTEAWSRLSETVVVLQYPQGKDTAAERELTVMPRNAPTESFAMIFKGGRLVLQTDADKRRAEGNTRELDWVRQQAHLAAGDPTKKWWTRLDMSLALEMPKSTAQDWINHAQTKGWVIQKPGKKGRGRGRAAEYCWNQFKTNSLWIDDRQNDGNGDFSGSGILVQGQIERVN